MRTSARNQFAGEIADAKHGAVNDEITLRLPGGQEIVATITSESAARLGLSKGKKAVAMIKATSVIIMVDADSSKVSARNVISGKVADLKRGAVNSDVSIADDTGLVISAIVTNSSVDRLALSVGKSAAAIFKASSVIVGVDG
jgi:molybdopterin-binding protein